MTEQTTPPFPITQILVPVDMRHKEAERLGHAITPLFESHEAVNETIQKVIAKHGVDFVVMATHHPRLTDHLFGSHASQTALHANCSVLILRGG